MLIKVDVDIDKNALVPCPLVMFKECLAYNCKFCEHYKGVAMMCEDPTKSWEQRYVIRCAGVIERRCRILDKLIED